MRQQDHVPVIIGSLGRDAAETRLLLIAAGIGEPLLGDGRYNGQDEVCFLVQQARVGDEFWQLLEDYGQETVLILDNQRNAFLKYLGQADFEHLGAWAQVDRLTALNSQNYSKFGENYYVVR